MAKEDEPITLIPTESIARVELFTEAARPPVNWELRCYFEKYYKTDEGEILGQTQFGSSYFSKPFGEIAADEIEVNGKKYTVAEIAEVIKAFCYQYKPEFMPNNRVPL